MDTITHGIIGALIGKAFFADDAAPLPGKAVGFWRAAPLTTGRVAILSATVGAVFPDIDVLAGRVAHNPLAMMTWHRGITHSIVLLPLWAILLAVPTRWIAPRLRWPSPTLGDLTAIYAVGLGSHIFLDVITSFGTMVWSPISYMRVAWDWLFIVDLSVTCLALLPQLSAWAFRRPERALRRAIPLWILFSVAAFALDPLLRFIGRPSDESIPTGVSLSAVAVFAIFFLLPLRHRTKSSGGRVGWCRAGVALVACYLTFAASMHHTALQQVTQFADQANVTIQNIGALPLPLWAARWQGLISTPDGVYRLQFDEFGSEALKIRYFANAPANHYVDVARRLPEVQTYLWFARFPVFRFFERAGEPVVQISDLRFYDAADFESQINMPISASPFTYEVVFATDGSVVHQGLASQ